AGALAAEVPAMAPFVYTLAALVSIDVVHEGLHSPSDVFAGAWLGLLVSGWIARRAKRRTTSSPGAANRRRSILEACRGLLETSPFDSGTRNEASSDRLDSRTETGWIRLASRRAPVGSAGPVDAPKEAGGDGVEKGRSPSGPLVFAAVLALSVP